MDTLNGFPIIATWIAPARGCERAGRIIVVDRGPEYEERYVVAWQADGATSWHESTYCIDFAEAERAFVAHIEREVRR
jgi:hypothetical protein